MLGCGETEADDAATPEGSRRLVSLKKKSTCVFIYLLFSLFQSSSGGPALGEPEGDPVAVPAYARLRRYVRGADGRGAGGRLLQRSWRPSEGAAEATRRHTTTTESQNVCVRKLLTTLTR